MKPRRLLIVPMLAALVLISACSTMAPGGGAIYGGTRGNIAIFRGGFPSSIPGLIGPKCAFLDFPFSLALDTALLPITLIHYAFWDIEGVGVPSTKAQTPPAMLKVTNYRMSQSLAIFWVDQKGNLTWKGTIPSGGLWSLDSYVGHSFEIHANGKAISKFVLPRGGTILEFK